MSPLWGLKALYGLLTRGLRPWLHYVAPLGLMAYA